MWIKSLETDVWINLNHITHFSIMESDFDNFDNRLSSHGVYAFLDASEEPPHSPQHEFSQDQVYLIVYRGSYKKCVRFINRKLRLQSISQWIGYLVAGGLGAVLTYLFQQLSKP